MNNNIKEKKISYKYGTYDHIYLEPTPISNLKSSFIQDFLLIEEFLASRKIYPKETSRYCLIKKILLSDTNINDKDHIKKFNIANIDLIQLRAIAKTYTELTMKALPPNFKLAITNDKILPGNDNNSGRNYLFENYVAARLIAAGCNVIPGEPDFLCEYNGFNFSVAVKRFKINKMEMRLREGRSQIEKSGLPGIIVFDISMNDILNFGSPFIGTTKEYLTYIHMWMENNFINFVRKKQKSIRLNYPLIPAVMAFHFGLNIQAHSARLVCHSHFSLFKTILKPPPHNIMLNNYHPLYQLLEIVRRTLPESSN